MENIEIAKIFYEIANYLEMENTPFKPAAYRKAAEILEGLKEDVEEIYKKGGISALEDIPGVGANMAKKIEEYLKKGHLKYLEDLRKKTPVDMEALTKIEGLGPRKIKVLYEKLGVKNIADLEKAVGSHKVSKLFGFGETSEENLAEAIAFLKRDKGRFPFIKIIPLAQDIVERLKKLPGVEKVSLAGSIRRKKETIGDIDILAVSNNPAKVMDFFVKQPEVEKIWGHGKSKSSVRLKAGIDADLRVVPAASYGAALQYFTGPKEHNIKLRLIAIDKGYKLNEYGLFRGKKMIKAETEEEIYKTLGQKYLAPEKRV